jgi:hypothetical protein
MRECPVECKSEKAFGMWVMEVADTVGRYIGLKECHNDGSAVVGSAKS